MNAQPAVSVCIPAYNAGSTIADTLKSVCEQTLRTIEILIVDDGSTDNTYSVVQSLRDPRMRILKQDNQGPGAARNRLIREAKGSFLFFS